MNYKDYDSFLESKRKKIIESGFDIKAENLNPALFDFQKYIVAKALKVGRYAIFADTGLGKTIMQLSWADEVVKHTGKSVLILAPLAVSGQTIEEGKKFDIHIEKLNVNATFWQSGIYITNYEQLENIRLDELNLSGIVLDESSILKNFTGVYKNKIIDSFKNTQYKLACTDTFTERHKRNRKPCRVFERA